MPDFFFPEPKNMFLRSDYGLNIHGKWYVISRLTLQILPIISSSSASFCSKICLKFVRHYKYEITKHPWYIILNFTKNRNTLKGKLKPYQIHGQRQHIVQNASANHNLLLSLIVWQAGTLQRISACFKIRQLTCNCISVNWSGHILLFNYVLYQFSVSRLEIFVSFCNLHNILIFAQYQYQPPPTEDLN